MINETKAFFRKLKKRKLKLAVVDESVSLYHNTDEVSHYNRNDADSLHIGGVTIVAIGS